MEGLLPMRPWEVRARRDARCSLGTIDRCWQVSLVGVGRRPDRHRRRGRHHPRDRPTSWVTRPPHRRDSWRARTIDRATGPTAASAGCPPSSMTTWAAGWRRPRLTAAGPKTTGNASGDPDAALSRLPALRPPEPAITTARDGSSGRSEPARRPHRRRTPDGIRRSARHARRNGVP